MLLADSEIRRRLEAGSLRIEPAPEDADIQPASIDLRLGGSFFRFNPDAEPIDPNLPFDRTWGETVTLTDDAAHVVIYPQQFLLGTTLECVTIPSDLVARVEGRSSLGRIGLIVHATAGFVDSGFQGQITLELYNLGPRPIILRSGLRVCQLAFTQLSGASDRPYGHHELRSKYQGQAGVVLSLGVGGRTSL